MANTGSIVLDIEKLPLKNSPGTVRQRLNCWHLAPMGLW
jgi:hypothetical protein